jgi:hypothetical protein
VCRFGQTKRAAIRLDGVDNLRNTVLYANSCRNVSNLVLDGGKETVRVCSHAAESCECTQ